MKIKNKNAFTIVELLTVISVIAIIIGLLVPGLNKVRKIAKDTKQQAQFHAIEVAIEMFRTEQDEYPESSRIATGYNGITGSHKLAEALLGRDLQGYDPLSNMDNPDFTTGVTTTEPYAINGGDSDASYGRRQGPYLDADKVEAFDAAQIYGTTRVGTSADIYAGAYDETGTATTGNSAPLITDVYKTTKITLPTSNKTVKAGTPILYYKANIANKTNVNTYTSNANMNQYNIYNMWDNKAIIELASVKESTAHEINVSVTAEREYFYDMIANAAASLNLGTNETRPYRAESYILLSAGYDGIFGTNDDVLNFGE